MWSPLTQQTVTTRVAALTYAQRFAPSKAAFEGRHGGDTPVWDLSFPGDRTAVLRMPTFALFDSTWDWKGFLDKALAESQRRESVGRAAGRGDHA